MFSFTVNKNKEWNFDPITNNVGQERVETGNTLVRTGSFITIGVMTGMLFNVGTTQGIVKQPTVGTEIEYLIESTNTNAILVYDGKEFVMSENITRNEFDRFDKSVEFKIDTISKGVEEIKNDIKDLVTKDDLATLEEKLLEAIQKSKSSITIWILGGLLTFLVTFLGYLFANPDISINIFKAISGN